MPLVNAYATVTEVREHLADANSGLSTALLERAINAASRAIGTHCGNEASPRRFWKDAVATARTYRVESREWVYVDDISARAGLVVKTGTDGVTFDTTVASTDYILEPSNADVVAAGDTVDPHAFWKITAVNGTNFTVDRRFPTMQVTAKFGWSSVPYEVNEACIIKAASLFKRKDSPDGVAGFGQFGVVRIGRSDPDVLDLLRRFTRIMVA